ncbi:hypothetical protein EJB05_05187 [Eragrostis curvula]|uniref:Uncharacterized protein n=1 Tax=Eragrostis curvula TaxID=38414 RepID=A0A5J9WCH1_9POAL|nr:hypothetical protein EJB05_05187 [Eragrostis curvula]
MRGALLLARGHPKAPLIQPGLFFLWFPNPNQHRSNASPYAHQQLQTFFYLPLALLELNALHLLIGISQT